jgi:HSP20 family protein
MAAKQEIQVQKKRELEAKEEATIPARVFVPEADIYETGNALMVLMEMPGVDKGNVDISVEDDVLQVQGRIDFSKYEGMDPVYTEYNVGNFARSFSLSREINQDKIDAEMKDGVLSLTLPKVEKAKPRTIRIT